MELSLPAKNDMLSVILKLPGEVCNLNCHYCYEKRKPSPEFQMLSDNLLREFFRKAGDRPLSIELHGGEPLIIGYDNMRKLLRECQKYKGPLGVVLQTNATLLNQNWLDLFKEEWPEIEISTSIDGPLNTTIHRVDYQDNLVHSKIEKVFELFQKNNLKVGVICTVTRAALNKSSDILQYFMRFKDCLSLLKLNPCFDFNVKSKISLGNRKSFQRYNPDSKGVPGWGITPNEFLGFLKDFFTEWVTQEHYMDLLVEPYLSVIRVIGGKKSNFCIYDQQKCSSMLTLYPDGRLSSCDELSMPYSMLSRNIFELDTLEDVIYFQTNKSLHKDLNDILKDCSNCNYKDYCNGGCLATRKRYKGSKYYHEYCNYRMGLIDFVRCFIEKE